MTGPMLHDRRALGYMFSSFQEYVNKFLSPFSNSSVHHQISLAETFPMLLVLASVLGAAGGLKMTMWTSSETAMLGGACEFLTPNSGGSSVRKSCCITGNQQHNTITKTCMFRNAALPFPARALAVIAGTRSETIVVYARAE